jgi:hypothetical protein
VEGTTHVTILTAGMGRDGFIGRPRMALGTPKSSKKKKTSVQKKKKKNYKPLALP